MAELQASPSPEPSLSLVGNFTGSTLVIDPETGFLMSQVNQAVGRKENGTGMLNAPGYGNGPFLVFQPAKKLEFLKFLKDLFPNYSKCAELVGISRRTFKNHYEIDRAFKACVDEIIDSHVDGIEDVRFKLALTTKGALDRMAVLNAYRREIYNPSIHVEISHNMTHDEATKRSGRLGNVVDATIVEKVKDLKRLNEKARE